MQTEKKKETARVIKFVLFSASAGIIETLSMILCEEPTGPFGAKSLGEIATGSPAPAISDALFNALGIHFDTLPITPEKVLRAIREKERGHADS